MEEVLSPKGIKVGDKVVVLGYKEGKVLAETESYFKVRGSWRFLFSFEWEKKEDCEAIK